MKPKILIQQFLRIFIQSKHQFMLQMSLTALDQKLVQLQQSPSLQEKHQIILTARNAENFEIASKQPFYRHYRIQKHNAVAQISIAQKDIQCLMISIQIKPNSIFILVFTFLFFCIIWLFIHIILEPTMKNIISLVAPLFMLLPLKGLSINVQEVLLQNIKKYLTA